MIVLLGAQSSSLFAVTSLKFNAYLVEGTLSIEQFLKERSALGISADGTVRISVNDTFGPYTKGDMQVCKNAQRQLEITPVQSSLSPEGSSLKVLGNVAAATSDLLIKGVSNGVVMLGKAVVGHLVNKPSPVWPDFSVPEPFESVNAPDTQRLLPQIGTTCSISTLLHFLFETPKGSFYLVEETERKVKGAVQLFTKAIHLEVPEACSQHRFYQHSYKEEEKQEEAGRVLNLQSGFQPVAHYLPGVLGSHMAAVGAAQINAQQFYMPTLGDSYEPQNVWGLISLLRYLQLGSIHGAKSEFCWVPELVHIPQNQRVMCIIRTQRSDVVSGDGRDPELDPLPSRLEKQSTVARLTVGGDGGEDETIVYLDHQGNPDLIVLQHKQYRVVLENVTSSTPPAMLEKEAVCATTDAVEGDLFDAINDL